MTPSSSTSAASILVPTNSWVHLALRLFIPAVGVLGLVTMGLFYRANPQLPPIRSDGYGHYLYLPAVFIQKDLSMRTEVAEWGENWDPNIGLTQDPNTGRWLNRFPPGQSLLMLPSFLLAHGSARVLGSVPDGVSPPYQVAAALNGLLALLIGLALLRRALAELFSPGVVLATLVGITFGTNLFHYATYDAIFSHVYSFALFAGLLLLLPRFYREPTVGRSLLLGGLMGLIVLVRNPNALMLLLVPMYGVYDAQTKRARITFIQEHWRKVALVTLAFLAVMSILFGYWKYVTGAFIAYSYRGYPFFFDKPQLLPVLFSVRKGLFFWAPILLLAMAGFVRAKEKLAPYLLPLLIIFLLHTYIVASWWHWAYGGSLGHRAYTEGSAFFALGLAGFFAMLQSARSRRVAAVICSLLLALHTMHMAQYWKRILPADDLTWEQYKAIFLKLS